MAIERVSGVAPELARIVENVYPGARIVRVSSLDPDDAAETSTTKGIGYGKPIRVAVDVHGELKELVLRGAAANAFGHDRRADRAAELLVCADTWPALPNHVQVLDVGAYADDGRIVSLANTGEFYLVTEYVEGVPYAADLRAIAERGALDSRDRERLDVLVEYLSNLHRTRPDEPLAYARAARDLVGSGEGIFGILDSYPDDTPGAPASRLQRIEAACVAWRWRLRPHAERLVRIHGDFHPFNVLFDEGSTLRLLDASRGSAGDASDDVACMAINYVFFALSRSESWRSAFAELWFEFWRRYLERSGDGELLNWVAPFLAWRGLVLASPVWYPELAAEARTRLLDFVEAALAQQRFSPALAERVFA
jgi:aminoglycoside phosphotransferase (APT) family kinase protein